MGLLYVTSPEKTALVPKKPRPAGFHGSRFRGRTQFNIVREFSKFFQTRPFARWNSVTANHNARPFRPFLWKPH